MMLVNSRLCHHPPFWTCSWCGCSEPSSLVSGGIVPNLTCRIKGARRIRRHTRKYEHVDRLKLGEHVPGLSAALSETSAKPLAALSQSAAEPSTESLVKPSSAFPGSANFASRRLRQELWRTYSITSDSLGTESTSAVPDKQPPRTIPDKQPPQVQDEDLWHFWNGPLPGDLAEVEAFCRIFRFAEQLHYAVMDALCSLNDSRELRGFSGNGYDGTASEKTIFFEGEDIPLLEEKVVSGLGCIGALLHQQKQEVFGGRLSGMGSSQNSHDGSTPPLAHFRAEMKRCCEQLEAALSCYFPPVDEQTTAIHRRFQRLRNVCFDAGYPRPEGSPSHADIPNWAAVRLWPSRGEITLKTDDEVACWRGGQITEEGLHWLIDKGFKVIVDLRSENGADQLAKSAVDAAVSLGNLRKVRLPVEPGTAPTKDQVEEFARLVADPENHPLYIHSQEGVGRTSALVSRWRELALRRGSQVLADASSPVNSFTHEVPNDKVGQVGANNEVANTSPEHAVHVFGEDGREDSLLAAEDSNGSATHVFNSNHSHNNASESVTENNGHGTFAATHLEGIGGSEGNPLPPEVRTAGSIDPFEAQRPRGNIFSRRAMSTFLKERRVVPARFMLGRRNAKAADLVSAPGDEGTVSQFGSIADPAGRWGLDGPGIPRAVIKLASYTKLDSHHLEDNTANADMAVVSTQGSRMSGVSESVENLVAGDQEVIGLQRNGGSLSISSGNSLTKGALFRVSGLEGPVDDTDEPGVVGDMCASTTGVVRIQSRKKAEMYLVRTDGFSCTRERVKESTLAFTHPSTQQQMLMWKTAPKTVLLLKKLGNELMHEAQQVASFLHYQEGMNVVVEPDVHDCFARFSGFGFIQTFYNQDSSDLHERVDFVVCLGGDGVILHASNLFRGAVPPVVSFNLGSLGFLTAHPFEDFMQDLRAIIHGNGRVEGVYITLRMRLRCELFRNGKSIPGKIFDVLNEVVVDRGSNPYLCKIECFERNRLITKVQADGVIVATPTGSTAYSTAAGGSMVHPNVPCMLFTPICPHSLSFRPVILPDSALLELKVPNDARSNAWVSFDGKKRQQLSRGDSVRVCMSEHPLPTVNKSDQTDDWFRSLVRCLNWNERLEQKAFTASS